MFSISCVPMTAPLVAAWTMLASSLFGISKLPRFPTAVGLSRVSGKAILDTAKAAGADMTLAARIATGSTLVVHISEQKL